VRKLKPGNWNASPFFVEVAAARYWSKRPSELGLCTLEDDPAVMVAYYQTVKSIEAYEQYLQEKEIQKANKRKR
jgi:hypothetical protein